MPERHGNDWSRREAIIEKARSRYIATGKTSNITEALRMYLANDAGPDEQVPLFITAPEIHLLRKTLERIRPICDLCGGDLRMQIHAQDQKGKSWPTAWYCKKCEVMYYSDKTPKEWLTELRNETRKQNLRGTDKPIVAAMPALREKPEI